MKSKKLSFIVSVSLLALSSQAFCVISYRGLETDVSSVIQAGSWSGNGAIQASLVPGTTTVSGGVTTPGNTGVLVSGFSGSGTLSIDSLASGGRLTAGSSASVGVSLAGGTADLILANTTRFDGGANNFNSVQFGNFAGVSSISVTIGYNQLIAGRTFGPTNFNAAPIVAATNLVTAGSGLTASDFSISATLNGVVSSTDGVNFSPGVSGFIATGSSNFTAPAAGDTTFSADSFASTWTLIKGYDIDGDGAYDGLVA